MFRANNLLSAAWIVGAAICIVILAWFPGKHIAFTIWWLLFVITFAHRRTFYPDWDIQWRAPKGLVTFLGWSVLTMLGVTVASMWLFDGWRFRKD
jgi:hypothetical protein